MTRQVSSEKLTAGPSAIRALLICVACVALLWAIVLETTGGFSLELAGVPIRSRSPRPAFIVFFVAACGAFLLRKPPVALDNISERSAGVSAAAIALGALVAGLTWCTYAASESDSYGYVSQAALWTSGSLTVAEPLAREVPWPGAEWTLSPLGYRPALEPAHIVPTYSPGYPLVMAAASLAGNRTIYFVVPLLGMLLVWATFRLGSDLDMPVTGLISALLLATSPVFLFHLVLPMSDIPAAFWWLLGLLLATGSGVRGAAAAGLAASMAVSTRPNLAPAGLALLLVMTGPARWTRRATFLAGLAPGVLFVAWLNNFWYGSPLRSGYGRTSDLFNLSNVSANLGLYARWMLESQSAFCLVAFVGLFVLIRRTRPPTASSEGRASLTLGAAAFASLVIALYLPYGQFDHWSYLRFLLPALPIIIVFSVAGAVAAVRRLPAIAHAPVLLVLTGLLVHWSVHKAVTLDAFRLWRYEGRYVEVGRDLRSVLPAGAVVLTVQHSGSARYYSGRQTMRWDLIEPSRLDQVIGFLRETHRPPYLLVESWEEADFERRFAGSPLGSLPQTPVRTWNTAVAVRLFDLGPK